MLNLTFKASLSTKPEETIIDAVVKQRDPHPTTTFLAYALELLREWKHLLEQQKYDKEEALKHWPKDLKKKNAATRLQAEPQVGFSFGQTIVLTFFLYTARRR